jgi:glycosyltransferase involved in cell wall biosynthesis
MGIDSQHYLDLNIVASEHLKRWMVGHGAQEERVAVCHINIDPQEWVPDREQRARVRRSLGLDDAVPVVLCAGRICPQKQPRVFAQTVLQLRQRRLPLVSIVAGDGSEMEWLRRFVRKHNLASHVLLLGAVSNQRVRELMTAADVFFLPSRWEGISLAAYEAMSCGLPVVTADVGGQCELVTPECGILITPSDEKTETSWYVEALTSLLIDRNKRSEMGSCARSRVIGNFPIAEMGSRMITLLELARTLNNIAPRSKPDQSEVQSSLRLTAETIRSYHLSMQLASYSSSPDWKVRTAFMLYRLLRPGYRWSIDHGVPGFARLGNKIKDALVAHST